MEAVWRLGAATAEQVRESLPEPLHDSSVRTLLRILESKGYLTHEARGKAYVYTAKVARAKAQGSALRDVLARFFGGSAEDLVLRLIEEDHLTLEQLDEAASRRAATWPAPQRRRAMNGILDSSDGWAQASVGFGLDVAAKATVLFLLAWLAHAALGRRRARERSAVWNACLLGLLCLPVASLAFPAAPDWFHPGVPGRDDRARPFRSTTRTDAGCDGGGTARKRCSNDSDSGRPAGVACAAGRGFRPSAVPRLGRDRDGSGRLLLGWQGAAGRGALVETHG